VPRPRDSRPQRQGPDVAPRKGGPSFAAASRRQGPRNDAGGPDPAGRLRFRGSPPRGPAIREPVRLTPRPAALRGDHRMPEPQEPSSEERSRENRSFRNDDAELRPLSEWFRRFASANGI